MLSKSMLKFFMLLIPIVLIISSMRSISTGVFSMPSMTEIIYNFSSIGTNNDLLNAVNSFNESKLIVDFGSVTDAVSFFAQVGNFFTSVGNFFNVVFQVFAVPFRVLGWLFGLF